MGQSAVRSAIKIADYAKRAGSAKNADQAKRAKTADTATKATKAVSADQAKKAKTADTATKATRAVSADQAKTAKTADEAQHARQADDSQKVGGHIVSETPQPGAIVPLQESGKLAAATVDLSGLYTKAQADSLFVERNARGVALAGLTSTATGTVTRYFNTAGGAPTIVKSATGVYDVSFPGLTLSSSNSVLVATPDTPSNVSTAIIADYCCSGKAVVVTNNATDSVSADRGFHLVVFGASPTG